MSEHKKAWDPETMGFGKHDYRHLDPATVNVEDFAKDLRGEQQHFGDVREENTAKNVKHPENDATLDWLGRPGTVFETDAEGLRFQNETTGVYMVSNMPVVQSPLTFCRAVPVRMNISEDVILGPEQTISCVDLGCAVDETNQFKQVRTKLLRKAKVDKSSREKLTKK